MNYQLQELEKKSIYILREARSKFGNVAVLWSMGKDSTLMLFLCKKAFFGKIPFRVIHLDNGRNFPETYQFRDKIVKEWGFDLIIGETKFEKDPVVDGLSKANALKKVVEKYKFDALIIPAKKCLHLDPKRVCPFLDWTELNVWQYIKEENIPVNQAALQVGLKAKTVDEIIEELKTTQASERQGCIKDGEKEQIMKRLRELGYM